jgi:hypothetical protein
MQDELELQSFCMEFGTKIETKIKIIAKIINKRQNA